MSVLCQPLALFSSLACSVEVEFYLLCRIHFHIAFDVIQYTRLRDVNKKLNFATPLLFYCTILFIIII